MNQAGRSGQGQEGLSFADALRDCLVSGVILIDGGHNITLLTPEAQQILGLEPAPPRTFPFEALPVPLQKIAREALSSGRPLTARKVELKPNRRGPLTLRVTATPVQPGKNAPGVLLVLNDLSSARRMQEHVQQLDRLADIGTLAASMAHEIKNALVAGKTFIDLLLEKNQEAELVDVVRRELSRIDAIVSRMLRFAGPGRLAFSPLSLHEVLEHSLRLVQPQLDAGGISLQRSFQAAPDQVNGDDYELQQAFVNLLLNAVEAMGAGGSLTVATENLEPCGAGSGERAALRAEGEVHGRLKANGQALSSGVGAGGLSDTAEPRQIRICVTDTGVGIPAENLERLFEPFFTTKPNGTGLGLAITQRIVQEHLGEVTVESHNGEGTTFQILLPLLEEAV